SFTSHPVRRPTETLRAANPTCSATGTYKSEASLRMLDMVLLAAEEDNLLDMVIGVRSQRAVVLAHMGDIAGARTEIDILSQYDLTRNQSDDIRHQSQLIEEIASRQPPA
ncbi:hypothetical protein, partial [Streptomyces ruber]|uniref:hypothetical protein n=2 Tax=Streptomyces TaxID=1883 RepID=UPI001E53738C